VSTRAGRALAVALVAGLALIAPAAAGAAAPVAASPLAANGFESPSCTSSTLAAQLSPAERTNCAVSGVAVAPVPLSNYAVDIDIPSGLSASGGEDVDSIVQDLFVTPVWTAVVWLVHVVLIALEWCYSIDLLGPSTLARAGSALGSARRIFTDPWLGLALALAAVGFAWQGLVRRRVLDTLGQVALLALMVLGGLWIIADPSGTVGAVGGLADRAALATVAASATGDPNQPVATVDGALGSVFDTAIDGPWCYLEFGDVNWCRNASELDPHLRATGVRLEQIFRAEASCHGPVSGLVECAPGGSALQSQLAGAATALAEARTNGELFLALPSDALQRTALTAQAATPTMYGTLCGSDNPTTCTASTAPQAEFRTASGTWPRVGGLLLIVAGTLAMLLLFGFLALRLLGAALATLLYLLLAPIAVLAPALGEAGRDAFRLWLTRLVGAVLAKLVYSVALGVSLLVASLLGSLSGLGWWTQWLLISVFWWMAFEHRHRLLSLVLHERSEPARRAPLATRAWLASRSAGAGVGVVRNTGRSAAAAGERAIEGVRRVRELRQTGGATVRLPPRATPRELERTTRHRRRLQVREELDAQVRQVREAGAQGRGALPDAVLPRARTELRGLEERQARIAVGLRVAEAGGDRRRAVSLRLRQRGVVAELAAVRGTSAQSARGGVLGAVRERLDRAAPQSLGLEKRTVGRMLDRAAQAPPGMLRRPGAHTAPLVGLAGVSATEYSRRAPPEQRAVRLEIERQLARRRELLREAESMQGRSLQAGVFRRRGSRDSSRGGREGDDSPVERRARQFGPRSR
jgi:hypothetical protein